MGRVTLRPLTERLERRQEPVLRPGVRLADEFASTVAIPVGG